MKLFREFLELSLEDMKDTLVDVTDPGQFARMQGKTAAVRDILNTLTRQPFSPNQEQ